MEKKNTVLLTVIAVATLLVAVVGATFAYFTASTAGTGTGAASTSTTTTIGSVALNLGTATLTGQDKMQYPGGKMVAGAKFDATVTGEGTFSATYTIKAKVDATALAATSSVKYAIYRTDAEVTGDAVTSCALKNGTVEGDATKKTYYYDGCAYNTAITSGAEKVAEATLTGGTSKDDITFDESLTGLTKDASQTYYYYLVVEYVNNNAEQNADQGKTVTAQITSIENANSTAAAA